MTESGDYISREAALVYAPLPKHLREYQTQNLDDAWEDGYFCALGQIRSVPAADVRPVVRGKWKNNHCSACGMMPMGEEIWECCDFAPPKFEWFMNFCPNCGADMREES